MADRKRFRPSDCLSKDERKSARAYARGQSIKNAMICVGSDQPSKDGQELLQSPLWLRTALEEARGNRIRFATLDSVARWNLLRLMADDLTPAAVQAQLIKITFDALKKGGDKTFAQAALDEDIALTDVERAQRLLQDSLKEDADAAVTAIETAYQPVSGGEDESDQ